MPPPACVAQRSDGSRSAARSAKFERFIRIAYVDGTPAKPVHRSRSSVSRAIAGYWKRFSTTTAPPVASVICRMERPYT